MRFTPEDPNIKINVYKWLDLTGKLKQNYNTYRDSFKQDVWLRRYKDEPNVWYFLYTGDQEPFDKIELSDIQIHNYLEKQRQKFQKN